MASRPTAADLLRDWRATGFLIVGLDGQVSLPYADGVPESHREVTLDLAEALGLDAAQEADFRKWLNLVARRHKEMRWEKLAPLCPVSESSTAREGLAMRLEFRKLEDGHGNLSAIAVFGVDTAPSQAMARQLEEERQRHRLRIRDFLALSANPPETVSAFLEDAATRLETARRRWETFLALRAAPAADGAEAPRAGVWDTPSGGGEPLGNFLFRELHMLKGNAGAFGFDGLAANVQESEDQLESLRPLPASEISVAGTAPGLQRLAASLSSLNAQIEEIRRALKLISGEGQEAMARILKWKLDRLQAAAVVVDPIASDPRLRALVDQSRRLSYLSPAYLARKYRNLVDRLAINQGKEVRFRVAANTGEIHPESFSRIDEALVHILRNMMDHGIETPAERHAAGKGEAEIGWEYVADDDLVRLRIRDDGRGMDAAALAARAVSLGLIAAEAAEALPEAERLALIFRAGFTTRDHISLVSGRGIGLALAARCVADQGGTLSVTSEKGKGTCFTLSLPPLG